MSIFSPYPQKSAFINFDVGGMENVYVSFRSGYLCSYDGFAVVSKFVEFINSWVHLLDFDKWNFS